VKRLLIFAASTLLAASSASSQVLLNETFNSENGGGTSLNYNAFANWDVSGQVDLVASGYGGVTCPGGTGACVDLDGSSGPGRITSKNPFAFSSGDVMRISFSISGNQRGGPDDIFRLGLDFGGNVAYSNRIGTGGLASFTGSGPFLNSLVSFEVSLTQGTAFSTWSMQFTADQSGSVKYFLGTPSADNQGPVVDNIVVERVVQQSVVPEPTTWAMLAFGLSALGVAARRRKA
jgi:hypothetical protein